MLSWPIETKCLGFNRMNLEVEGYQESVKIFEDLRYKSVLNHGLHLTLCRNPGQWPRECTSDQVSVLA